MASKHLFGNYGKHLPNNCYIGETEQIPCDNINQRYKHNDNPNECEYKTKV